MANNASASTAKYPEEVAAAMTRAAADLVAFYGDKNPAHLDNNFGNTLYTIAKVYDNLK